MSGLRGFSRRGDLPDWRSILAGDWSEWESARASAKGGVRILLATSSGGDATASALDTAIAVALTMRGAEVEFLLCDQVLPACQMCEVGLFPRVERFLERGPRRNLCGDCYPPAARMVEDLGLTLRRYGDHLGDKDRERLDGMAVTLRSNAIPGYAVDGIPVGEHALAGALRFYGTGALPGGPRGEAVLRRYLRSALYTSQSLLRLLDRHTYRAVVAHHGSHVPMGIVADTTRAADTPLVTWSSGDRSQSVIFSHDDTCNGDLGTEPPEAWEHLDLTRDLERRTMAHIGSRRTEGETGQTHTAKPIVGCLTDGPSGAWPSHASRAFATQFDWLRATVEWFGGRPDLQLLIGETRSDFPESQTRRQSIAAFLAQEFPRLPANVSVIPPESGFAERRWNAVLVYATESGAELTSLGLPVVVAGPARIRNKGLTFDPPTAEEYFDLLETLPFEGSLDTETMARARRYAFHLFFRRMIPLPFLKPAGTSRGSGIEAGSLAPFRPGGTPGLDVICEGIVGRAPFVYPAERLES